jgi:hypothetical protein
VFLLGQKRCGVNSDLVSQISPRYSSCSEIANFRRINPKGDKKSSFAINKISGYV